VDQQEALRASCGEQQPCGASARPHAPGIDRPQALRTRDLRIGQVDSDCIVHDAALFLEGASDRGVPTSPRLAEKIGHGIKSPDLEPFNCLVRPRIALSLCAVGREVANWLPSVKRPGWKDTPNFWPGHPALRKPLPKQGLRFPMNTSWKPDFAVPGPRGEPGVS
jgi:hypothetical protein